MQNPRFGYSGGRYHALLAAEALAAKGHIITLFSNTETQVFEDFAALPGHDRINFIVSKRFEYSSYLSHADIALIVPSMSNDERLFSQATRCAHQYGAKLALLNFESPNWFNSLSPNPRDPALWKFWLKYSKACSVILCSANESVKYAKEYYEVDEQYTILRSCPPSINNYIRSG